MSVNTESKQRTSGPFKQQSIPRNLTFVKLEQRESAASLLGSRLLVALASEVILEPQKRSFYRAPLHSMHLIWYLLLMPLSKDYFKKVFFPHS